MIRLRYAKLARPRGKKSADLRAAQDRELTQALASRHALGKPIERDLFRPVALLLVREGL